MSAPDRPGPDVLGAKSQIRREGFGCLTMAIGLPCWLVAAYLCVAVTLIDRPAFDVFSVIPFYLLGLLMMGASRYFARAKPTVVSCCVLMAMYSAPLWFLLAPRGELDEAADVKGAVLMLAAMGGTVTWMLFRWFRPAVPEPG